MDKQNKSAEEIKNIPETIHLMTSEHVEDVNEGDELNFSDWSTEYLYWAVGKSNDSYDTNYILKSKYDKDLATLQQANDELQKKIEELKKKQQWISIKDLPEDQEPVMLCGTGLMTGNWMEPGYYFEHRKTFHLCSNDERVYPLFWRPMPDYPKLY